MGGGWGVLGRGDAQQADGGEGGRQGAPGERDLCRGLAVVGFRFEQHPGHIGCLEGASSRRACLQAGVEVPQQQVCVLVVPHPLAQPTPASHSQCLPEGICCALQAQASQPLLVLSNAGLPLQLEGRLVLGGVLVPHCVASLLV